jgi:hypothetical protein
MMSKTWNLSKQNLQFLVDYLNKLDFAVEWQVIIKEKKSTRSMEQNARLWELYTSIAEYTGYTKDEVHELMGYKFLREQKEINGEVFETVKSTTKLNTKEMTDYQDQIVIWASQLGWSWN